MPRIFNTAGPCLPGKHYMLPPTRRIPQIRDLIEGEFYFVLHAPRQTGKTTLLRSLSAALTAEGRHAALTVSLESFTSDDPAATMPQILDRVSGNDGTSGRHDMVTMGPGRDCSGRSSASD